MIVFLKFFWKSQVNLVKGVGEFFVQELNRGSWPRKDVRNLERWKIVGDNLVAVLEDVSHFIWKFHSYFFMYLRLSKWKDHHFQAQIGSGILNRKVWLHGKATKRWLESQTSLLFSNWTCLIPMKVTVWKKLLSKLYFLSRWAVFSSVSEQTLSLFY